MNLYEGLRLQVLEKYTFRAYSAYIIKKEHVRHFYLFFEKVPRNNNKKRKPYTAMDGCRQTSPLSATNKTRSALYI